MRLIYFCISFTFLLLSFSCSDYSATITVTNQTDSLHDVTIKNYQTFSLDIDESIKTDIDWDYIPSEPFDDTEDITVLVDDSACADFSVADGESKHINIIEIGLQVDCSY